MENHPLEPPLQPSASPRHLEPDPDDIEKLRKWQEDRITRKLRGEYESAVLHLSDLVSFNGAKFMTAGIYVICRSIEICPHP